MAFATFEAALTTSAVRLIWILFFCGWMGLLHLRAQPYVGVRVDANAGFPAYSVYDVFSDRFGVRWFGTDEGLYRYNGVEYTKIPFSGHWSNSVSNICATNDGTLWCRNFSNQVFAMTEGTMTEVAILRESFANSELKGLFAEGDHLILYTENEVLVYHPSNQTIERIIGIEGTRIVSTSRSSNYTAVSDTDGKVGMYRGSERIAEISLNNDLGRQVTLAHLGSDLVLGWHENRRMHFAVLDTLGSIKRTAVMNTDLSAIVYSARTVGEEVVFLHAIGFIVVDADLNIRSTETGVRCSGIALGSDGRRVVSSLDGGYIVYDPKPKSLVQKALPNRRFTVIESKKDGYLLGDNQGYMYDMSRDSETGESGERMGSLEIQFIRFDTTFNRIISTSGVWAANKRFNMYAGRDALFLNDTLFAGSHLGLQAYPFEEWPDAVTKEIFNTNQTNFVLRSVRVRAIESDPSGLLYVGYADSLLCYGSNKRNPVARHAIFTSDLCRGRSDTLWATTTDGRLLAFKQGECVATVDPETIIGEIGKELKWYNGRLFLLTERGINTVECNAGIWSVNPDKFVSTGALTANSFLPQYDSFLVVTPAGLVKVAMEDTPQEPFVSLLFQHLLTDGTAATELPIEVHHAVRTVEIGWEVIGYDFDRVELYYQLEPAQSKPIRFSPSTNRAWFNELAAGDYRFHLFASHRGKVLPFGSIDFTVKPPFWLTWWFIVFEIMAGFFVVWLAVRISQRSLRKKQFYRERLIQSKLTALRSQMNPHFLYNALNSLQGMIYGGQINQAGNYVSKFSEYLRNVLKHSDAQLLTVHEEIAALRTYLEIEQERFGNEFSFAIEVSEGVDQNAELPTMIIQPFVENAIKHGLMNKAGEKRLWVELAKTDEGLTVEITDNGIGREAALAINQKRLDKPKSFATRAIDERVHLFNHQGLVKLNYTIDDAYPDQANKGTRVRIVIKTP